MRLKPILLPILVAAALGLQGCESDEQLPPQSRIRIFPEQIHWKISPTRQPCEINPDLYNDQTISISVVDGSDVPLGDVKVRLLLDLAGNTFSGTPRLALYADRNSNGVVDGPEELVSDESAPAFETQTGQHSGNTSVIVRVNLSCEYRGTLYAYAGDASASTEINVQLEDEEVF
jgi:hypothetical protein